MLILRFASAVVQEWKGWVTGSLPMAVIAVIALIKPDLVPLPLWVWILLIFVAGFVCAVFRVYRNVMLELAAANRTLASIASDRPFAYYSAIFNFRLEKGKIFLPAWGIYIENLGDKMLKYHIKNIWLENSSGERFSHKPLPDKGGFISAKTRMTYSLLSDQDGGMLVGKDVGTHWKIGFEIDYDNVPPLAMRTTEQVIKYTLTSLAPPQTGNTILYRDER